MRQKHKLISPIEDLIIHHNKLQSELPRSKCKQKGNKKEVYGKEMGLLPPRQGEKETMDLPYNLNFKHELYLKLKLSNLELYLNKN